MPSADSMSAQYAPRREMRGPEAGVGGLGGCLGA